VAHSAFERLLRLLRERCHRSMRGPSSRFIGSVAADRRRLGCIEPRYAIRPHDGVRRESDAARRWMHIAPCRGPPCLGAPQERERPGDSPVFRERLPTHSGSVRAHMNAFPNCSRSADERLPLFRGSGSSQIVLLSAPQPDPDELA